MRKLWDLLSPEGRRGTFGLLVVLLLPILEQVKPVVSGTSTQLDDVALEALITALRREEQGAASGRPGNSGAL